ncbi:MAG TPA: DUF4214 domain-containing protein [Gemmataceae bacterium]|nr:DUF4214 domain-containing protein [Gemmataceae bacterium]
MKNWFRQAFASSPRNSKRETKPTSRMLSKKCRPLLETLEDRTVPSGLNISNGVLSYIGNSSGLTVSTTGPGGTYTLVDNQPFILSPGAVSAGWTTNGNTATGPDNSVTSINLATNPSDATISIQSVDADTTISASDAGSDTFDVTANGIPAGNTVTFADTANSGSDSFVIDTGGTHGTFSTGQFGRESYQAAGRGLVDFTTDKPGFADNFTGVANGALTVNLNTLYTAPTALNTTISVSAGEFEANVSGVFQRFFPISDLASVVVGGTTAGESLTIDYANGNPLPGSGLSYNPLAATGGGSNSLALEGGSFTSEVYTATGPGAGSITYNGSIPIQFSNLTPIDDTVPSPSFIFNSPSGNQTVDVVNGPIVGGAQTDQINDGGTGSFELINFGNKTAATVDTQAGNDTIQVDVTLVAAGLTTLDVNSGNGNGTFNISPVPVGLSATIDGGAPTAVPGNTLNYDGPGAINPTGTGAGTITQPGFALVTFSGIGLAFTSLSSVVSTPGGQVVTVTGDQDFPGEDDAFAVTTDATGQFLEISLNGATGFFAEQAAVLQININGLAGNDNLTVDSSHTLIDIPNGIRYDGGTGFNTLDLTQTGGVTQTSDTYNVGPNPGEGSSVIVGPSGTQTVYFQNLAPVLDNVPAVLATVNGASADSTIDYSQGPGGGIFVGNTGLVTVDNQEPYEFNNKANLVINALAGSDAINISHVTTPTALTGITVNGGGAGGSGTLTITGTSSAESFEYDPTGVDSGSVLATGSPSVAFTAIGAVVIDGQSGTTADTLAVRTPAGQDEVLLKPGSSPDSGTVDVSTSTGATAPLTFHGLGQAATLTFLSGAVNTPEDSLEYDGAGGADTFTVTAPNGGTIQLNHQIDVFIPGVNSLRLNSLGGSDTFNVTPLTNAAINIDGGGPASALNFDAANLALFTANGRFTANGQQPVTFTNIGPINVANAASVSTFYGPDTADRTTALAGLSPAQRFVQVLYLNALGRTGSLSELNAWVATLQSSSNGQAVVAADIEDSPEARRHLVDTWYRTYLGRPLGANEQQPWVSMLTGGASEEVTLSGILGSLEFNTRAQLLVSSGTADERYVQALYLVLLNRTGSNGEVASHVADLPSLGHDGVAQEFLFSAELRGNLIEAYYNTLLHRSSDAAGLAAWFSSGLDANHIRLEFEASIEFYTFG